MSVRDPTKEKEMLHNFETIFRPEAARHPGYLDVKMLKLRGALQGSAPAGINYRFSLTYESEETAAEMGSLSRASESLADDRKHTLVQELYGAVVRRCLRKSSHH
jgi:hypothetical protein